MSGFSFPPPPPPPPKAPPAQLPSPYDSSNRGRGRGRGGNWTGQTQRGRGQFPPRGHYAPNSFHQPNTSQQPPWQSGPPQHAFNSSAPSHRTDGFSGSQAQGLPPGAFINPNFAAAHANHSNSTFSGRYAPTQHFDAVPEAANYHHDSPSRTTAGHKRKLDALRGPAREKKAGPQTAPAVPGFGAPILASNPSSSSIDSNEKAIGPVRSKPAARSLGLTPGTDEPQYSPSESDEDERDNDEEAIYAELGSKIAFEHNGVVMTLNSPADLVAWKRERQKNWPTKMRMAEKEGERRRTGEERKRLLASTASMQGSEEHSFAKWKHEHTMTSNSSAASGIQDQKPKHHESLPPVEPETDLEKVRREMTEQAKRLEDLRRRVAESESRNREAKAQKAGDGVSAIDNVVDKPATDASKPAISAVDESDVEQDAELENENVSDDLESTPLESSSVVSSDPYSKADSDDEPPEEVSTTLPIAAPSNVQLPVCKYFRASGYCRDGDACRFKHEANELRQTLRKPPQNTSTTRRPRMDVNEGKKSIHQRLVEQEQDEENRLALKAIKYLGRVGLFKADVANEGV